MSGRVAIQWQNLHRDQAIGIETEIDGRQTREAAQHQAGAGYQQHGERDLNRNEALSTAA